jgi:hypothetical protein
MSNVTVGQVSKVTQPLASQRKPARIPLSRLTKAQTPCHWRAYLRRCWTPESCRVSPSARRHGGKPDRPYLLHPSCRERRGNTARNWAMRRTVWQRGTPMTAAWRTWVGPAKHSIFDGVAMERVLDERTARINRKGADRGTQRRAGRGLDGITSVGTGMPRRDVGFHARSRRAAILRRQWRWDRCFCDDNALTYRRKSGSAASAAVRPPEVTRLPQVYARQPLPPVQRRPSNWDMVQFAQSSTPSLSPGLSLRPIARELQAQGAAVQGNSWAKR